MSRELRSEEVLEILANDLLMLDKLCEDESVNVPNPLADSEPESGPGGRFQLVSEEDCDSFIKENENKNTNYKTKSDVKLLFDWMRSISEQRDLEDIPPQGLDMLLARFFLGK